jgi:hypothetical protein
MKKLIMSAVVICLLSFTMGGAQSSQKIDPRLIGNWLYGGINGMCLKYTFNVDGTGRSTGEWGYRSTFNFTVENGKIRFYNNVEIIIEDDGDIDNEQYDQGFGFSDDGKTLTFEERDAYTWGGRKVKYYKKTFTKLNTDEPFCEWGDGRY